MWKVQGKGEGGGVSVSPPPPQPQREKKVEAVLAGQGVCEGFIKFRCLEK